MAMISRFEDLPAWQKTRKLVKTIYKNEPQLEEAYEQAGKTRALIGGFTCSTTRST